MIKKEIKKLLVCFLNLNLKMNNYEIWHYTKTKQYVILKIIVTGVLF